MVRPAARDCRLSPTEDRSRRNPLRQLFCHRQAVDRAAIMRREQRVYTATPQNKNKPQEQAQNLLQIPEKTTCLRGQWFWQLCVSKPALQAWSDQP
jgi:hypothetical protein